MDRDQAMEEKRLLEEIITSIEHNHKINQKRLAQRLILMLQLEYGGVE